MNCQDRPDLKEFALTNTCFIDAYLQKLREIILELISGVSMNQVTHINTTSSDSFLFRDLEAATFVKT